MARFEKDYKRIKHFYNNSYHGVRGADLGSHYHERSMIAKLGPTEGMRVLDVGCGTCSWLSRVVENGGIVHGIDISDIAVQYCLERLEGADIRTGGAEKLPWADSYFDYVTCLGSLEHFVDQPAALNEMFRVAKENAKFLILVPNRDFLTRKMGIFKGTEQNEIKETVRSIGEWERLFLSSGLHVEKRWKDLHVLSLSWILSGKFVMWPFRLLQALLLLVWPLRWQYQIFFLCRKKKE